MSRADWLPGGGYGAGGRVARAVALLAVLGAVAPFVAFAVPGVVGAQGSFVVLSGSMEPAIGTGDAVLVERVDPADVSAGDVITFREAGESTPVTHRVVEVRAGERGRTFVTKGDANEGPDPGVVTESELLGRVAVTLPLVGYVVGFGGSATGFVALVVVPFGLLLFTELRAFVGRARAGTSGGDVPDEPGRGADRRTATPSVGDAAGDDTAETERGEGSGTETMHATETERRRAGQRAAGERARGDERPATTGEEPADAGGIAIAPGELRFGFAALALFGPYTAWVAYATTAGWAVGAAVAANATLAVVGALYLLGRRDGDAESPADGATEPARAAATGGGVDDGR